MLTKKRHWTLPSVVDFVVERSASSCITLVEIFATRADSCRAVVQAFVPV